MQTTLRDLLAPLHFRFKTLELSTQRREYVVGFLLVAYEAGMCSCASSSRKRVNKSIQDRTLIAIPSCSPWFPEPCTNEDPMFVKKPWLVCEKKNPRTLKLRFLLLQHLKRSRTRPVLRSVLPLLLHSSPLSSRETSEEWTGLVDPVSPFSRHSGSVRAWDWT